MVVNVPMSAVVLVLLDLLRITQSPQTATTSPPMHINVVMTDGLSGVSACISDGSKLPSLLVSA